MNLMSKYGLFTHDASPMYTRSIKTEQGYLIDLFLRSNSFENVESVKVRLLRDGEPWFVEANREEGKGHGYWWRASFTATTDIVRYRWLICAKDGVALWLNGHGLFDRAVPDIADFEMVVRSSVPDWWAGACVYQVFPDRFARSSTRELKDLPDWANGWIEDDLTRFDEGPGQRNLYGGTLWGLADRLDYIKSLGFDAVYLTPFFEGRSNHRYDAISFEHVDPFLGGDEALIHLINQCHVRGMKLIGDLTTNHTGVCHEWFRKAQKDEQSVEHDFYYWNQEGKYECWLGVPTLPKLNYSSPVLRERMFGKNGVVRRYLQAPFHMDGWRIDVANMTGRCGRNDWYREVAQLTREAVDAEGDKVLIAEHAHDLTNDIRGQEWHGAMNYAGFTRPIWEWLANTKGSPVFMGSPAPITRRPGTVAAQTLTDFNGQIPWKVWNSSFNLVASHDTARLRDIVDSAGEAAVALAASYLLPGVPMVLYGDELYLQSIDGDNCRVPMVWNKEPGVLTDVIMKLAQIRKESEAVKNGSFRWALNTDDTLAFWREYHSESVLVTLSRGKITDRVIVVPDSFGVAEKQIDEPFGKAMIKDGVICVTPDNNGISVTCWN
ncbi:alpha-amylase family glycosyl hydrolase [Arcanobacterium phocae]|uniref:alpha-amylase family glycosyl hydrolase n=1 Tax=Arcanobacterium phocae TaxID=131112 RepID=UPI001C0EED3E|nr:alpha-amylase family glycosyl hydrolase [Arcanobacterium phocae]